jgi:hypothetical protein
MDDKKTRLEELNMGFDLHGRGPFSTNPPKYPEDEEFQAIEKYHQDMRLYERDNPGYYFHNNVWYWRPLWQYVCNMCEDILTIHDAERGMWNDSHLIPKTKAKKIAKRLEKSIKNGDLKEWEKERKKHLQELGMVECNICEGIGYRNLDDSTVSTVCNACNGKKERPHFDTNYPWDRENLKDFIEFCKNSGGFEIS